MFGCYCATAAPILIIQTQAGCRLWSPPWVAGYIFDGRQNHLVAECIRELTLDPRTL